VLDDVTVECFDEELPEEFNCYRSEVLALFDVDLVCSS
jgi:hypothetical protein